MKRIVGVAEMAVSRDPDDTLITHSLGSCLGIMVYDPVAVVGGLLHAMLPTGTLNPDKASQNPCMFVDSGVVRLFEECYKVGAEKKRMILKVAGGAACKAAQTNGKDFFAIGSRNITVLRKLLWKNGVLIKGSDVGGSVPRTVSLDLRTGEVLVKVNGATAAL